MVRTPGAKWLHVALFLAAHTALSFAHASAQEPAAWRGGELFFHTFSIAAIDPATGESGVAVTTRNACVGNGVPWVRKGVGAVATQASTRTEYGYELLDLMEQGVSPEEALAQRLAEDENAARRQIGVIGVDGRSAQHTGTRSQWAGHRAGPNYVAQGNTLVGPEVIDAVGESFESTEGSAAPPGRPAHRGPAGRVTWWAGTRATARLNRPQ